MSYFGASSRMAGDPGFFGTLFGRVRRAAGAFAGVSGPIAAGRALFQPPRGGRIPGIGGIALAGPTRGRGAAAVIDPATGMPRKRRRMNVTNDKALRRAIRRTSGFVKLAKRALKNTDFVIVSKSSLAVSRAKKKTRADIHHAG